MPATVFWCAKWRPNCFHVQDDEPERQADASADAPAALPGNLGTSTLGSGGGSATGDPPARFGGALHGSSRYTFFQAAADKKRKSASSAATAEGEDAPLKKPATKSKPAAKTQSVIDEDGEDGVVAKVKRATKPRAPKAKPSAEQSGLAPEGGGAGARNVAVLRAPAGRGSASTSRASTSRAADAVVQEGSPSDDDFVGPRSKKKVEPSQGDKKKKARKPPSRQGNPGDSKHSEPPPSAS